MTDYRSLIADTLSITHEDFPKDYKLQVVEEDGLDLLYVFNCQEASFDIFDLWTKRHVKHLPSPKVSDNPAFKAITFDIVGVNEIYLLSQEGDLVLMDSAGKSVEYWEIQQELADPDYQLRISEQLSNFAVLDQKAYLPIIHRYDKNGKFTLKGKPAMQVYDLQTGELEGFGGYPKASYKGKSLSNPKYEFTTLKMDGEEKLMFSYLKDPELKVYKTKNNRAKSKEAVSPFLVDRGVKPQRDEFGNIIRYINPNGFYHNLYHDPERNLYYRTVAHHHDTSPEDSNNGWARRPFSIQVIDHKFNLISEISIPETEPLDHMKMTVVKEGLLLQICKQKDPKVVDFLVLDVYKGM